MNYGYLFCIFPYLAVSQAALIEREETSAENIRMEQKIGMEKPKAKVKTPPTKRKPRAANLRYIHGHLIRSQLCLSVANRMFYLQ